MERGLTFDHIDEDASTVQLHLACAGASRGSTLWYGFHVYFYVIVVLIGHLIYLFLTNMVQTHILIHMHMYSPIWMHAHTP
jgi:hypothetical protein